MTDLQLKEHEAKCLRCRLVRWLWFKLSVYQHYCDYMYGDLK